MGLDVLHVCVLVEQTFEIILLVNNNICTTTWLFLQIAYDIFEIILH